MNRQRVNSSNISAVRYNASDRTLEVEFHGGRIYEYFNIPASVYRDLLSATSKGSYFYYHIRRAPYQYRRLK